VSEAVIRIGLIDDHELFLAGLRALIQGEPGLTVIGQAMNRTEALDLAAMAPDILVLDLILGNDNGLEFLSDLLEAGDGVRVLVVTEAVDHDLHLQAVRLGAMGVMSKVEAPSSFFKAIRKVHNGEMWLNRSVLATVVAEAFRPGKAQKADPEAAKIATLTSRELEVINLVGEGFRSKQIGERLFISGKTVGHHLSSIFGKLHVSDRLELAVYAYRHRLAKVSKIA
jgi:two-component system, NarL family, nitrate/nitrite response regulator NarL